MTFEPSLSWLKLTDSENEGKSVYIRVDLVRIFGSDEAGSRIQVSNDTYVLVSETPEEIVKRIVALVNGHA